MTLEPLSPAPTRAAERGRRNRVRVTVAAGVAAIAIGVAAAPLFGADELVHGLLAGTNGPDLSHAQSLVSTEVAPGKTMGVWRIPSKGGGRCVFLASGDTARANMPPSAADGGALCADTPAAAAATDAAAPPLGAIFSWSLEADGSVTTIVFGAARPDSHIARVALRRGTSESDVPFAHAHFILSLPGSDSVGSLPSAAGPLALIGYDAKGTAVVTLDLNKLAATPTE